MYLLIYDGLELAFSATKLLANTFLSLIFYELRYLDFKWSKLHYSFTENIFLMEIQENANHRNIQLKIFVGSFLHN